MVFRKGFKFKMKALNLAGQEIINESKETRFNNKLKIMSLLRTAIYSIQKDIELTTKAIEESYYLLQESIHCTFICIDGLEPLVLNEMEDAENHNTLDLINEKFYKNAFLQIFCLVTENNYEGTNILSYSRGKIKRLLLEIYNEICLIEPLEFGN